MKRLALTCHLCGEALPDYFTAVSPADTTDRPFLVHRGCAPQVEASFARVDIATRREPNPRKK